MVDQQQEQDLEFDDDKMDAEFETPLSIEIENYDPWEHGILSLYPDNAGGSVDDPKGRSIRVFPDGNVQLRGMEPDEASRAFWDWIKPTADRALCGWFDDVLANVQHQINAGDLTAAAATLAGAQARLKPEV